MNSLKNLLNLTWSSLSSDPVKSIAAIASMVSASAAIGGLIVGWKNLNKDTTRVRLTVKRAQNGPLILQHPEEEFLLFEIYNQGIAPIAINEVGIKVPQKYWSKPKLVNLVDLPDSYLDIRGQESAIGSVEYIGIPGTIPARTTGVFLLTYSRMRTAYTVCQQRDISPDSPDFVGSQRLIRAFHEFKNLETPTGKNLQIIPYVLTGTGDYFFGKKSTIKLGHLGDLGT